ncbi:substrate-binding domain-containing protein [Myroides sp. M-43]|uniref:PstS family phosphate ABC transporter substrate-binding protein n=1 Tax=Myroides oncorhynchi TaxID=2893756 RepID=UPI001E3BCAEB|nr:substrate-binding domain-containing protein [Myroides oncorhynchi]MCC9042811.1 substrate-binding domain-containing protein [Myroides oncorhynchi]
MIKRSFKVFSYVLAVTVLSSVFVECKKKEEPKVSQSEIDFTKIEETPVSGYTKILVDESIYPIANDVNTMYMYEYNRSKIDLLKMSTNEVLQLLLNDSIRVAILPRTLTESEVKRFEGRVTPKMTHFANDAVVFIANKTYTDSVVDYNQVLKNVVNSPSKDASQAFFVFDNANSNVVEVFKDVTKTKELSKDIAYYAGDSEAVVEYISKNPQAIGVIGQNWLTQPSEKIAKYLNSIKVLGVKNSDNGKFYKASQNSIAEGTYPLIRKLYVVDIQGKSGLGVGYASYIAGYKGQRIILKSGLLPFKVPPRELNVRDKI